MKMLKLMWGVVLCGALVMVIQLVDPAKDSPTTKFQRLPEVSFRALAEAELAAGRSEAALLVLDYVIASDLPEKSEALGMRQRFFAQLATENNALGRLKATGWATVLAGGNSFENLAGSTVADAVLYGEIAELARQGACDVPGDEFGAALGKISPITTVFPPAEGAITLAKAARRAGAINESLLKQLRQMLTLMQVDPKTSLAVEKFRENFMPLFELSRRCRTWGEFAVILQQADSADQLKVLTKMVTTTPDAARRLSQILVVAGRDGRATSSACLDYVMREGPKGAETLSAAMSKGAAGLKFAVERPGLAAATFRRAPKAPDSVLGQWREKYLALRYQYGPIVAAVKYLLIAVLTGLLVLAVVPGRYLEKLLASGPASALAGKEPGPIHYVLSALAVGAVLSVLAYLLSLAVRPAAEPAAVNAVTGEVGAALSSGARGDSALLSGTVVLVSLAIHAVVWFFVRGKIRLVEDDEAAEVPVRLKRLENLDVFLDLPLFTGLALTVVAFILITLDAGMSRHFAYTSTVVGILSSVSLRIRYVYPLKERLVQSR